MKILVLILALFSFAAWSQDPTVYLNNFDAKVYSLKTKGIKDFVVDIQSSKLTKQLNDQQIFGKVKEVTFRTYWTANPERIAIEIIGLPEGFREIKEDLKLTVVSLLDNLLPISTVQRFAGYKFHTGVNPKEFIATDSSGIANIQSYVLKFDLSDKLVEVIGKKAIGTLNILPKYEKDSFASGKWVLKSLKTTNSENGQTFTTTKELDYGTSQGMGVLSRVTVETEQKSEAPGAKPLKSEESIDFKNYKISTGEALKYFLGESPKN
jgi:hypothetical protein